MKTKLILIAVITIIGISLFSAFKQSEGSKKYLTMTLSGKDAYIIDENGEVTEKKIADTAPYLKGTKSINKEINTISAKGYKLINTVNLTGGPNTIYTIQYIFEKE
jgi:hypothetical protein